MRLEHAHWPLVWMLVLTQLAAGLDVCAAALVANAPIFGAASAPVAVAAFAILNLGLGVSVLYLGRPLGAWRAFFGLRTSWMSREILVFSAFAAPAAGFAAASLWPLAAAKFALLQPIETIVNPATLAAPLAVVTAVLGLLGVFCSAMIYVDTRRAYWSSGLTFTKFFGTVLLLGSAGTAAILAWTGVLTATSLTSAAVTFAIVATVIRTALAGWEFHNLRQGLGDPQHPNHRTALILWNLLRPLVVARAVLFVGSTTFGLAAIAHGGLFTAVCATVSFLLTFVSQIIERYFFFTAVVAPRMPGPLVPRNSEHT